VLRFPRRQQHSGVAQPAVQQHVRRLQEQSHWQQQQQQQQPPPPPLPQQQLTCAAIAAMPQSTLAEAISSVHFNNVKARHLREASQQLLVRHGGRVPASHFSLLALPGIGEKMAGLLRHVHKAVAANMATAMATPTAATEAAPRPADV
jgi:hypothetical protein